MRTLGLVAALGAGYGLLKMFPDDALANLAAVGLIVLGVLVSA